MNTKYQINSKFKILRSEKVFVTFIMFLGSVTLSYSTPNGGNVISGTVVIDNSTTNKTNITQSTNKSIIDWGSFNIGSNETVNFIMPSSNSSSLNRVIGNESSNIYGSINSNGQVFLINQNGIYFSNNSRVNTAGFTASTLNITNDNFNNANYVFEGNRDSSIINFGTITTNNAYTALLAKDVSNEGIIKAELGNVQLASGSKITLNINGNSLVKLTIDEGAVDSLVENKGLIKADGGIVYLTSQALDEVLNGLVNNTGVIEANSINEQDGEIILFAHGGTANIDGKLESSQGFIETSGKELNVASTTEIIADTWLLDPTDLTIESSGGSVLTGSSVSASAIESNLSTTNITLKADDNIYVNEDITWSSDKKLTLESGDDYLDKIYVNATIENTNSTTGGVYFDSKNATTTQDVEFSSSGKVIVNNVYQLQWISRALYGNYELGSDIDAGVTKTDTVNWIYGFLPIAFSAGSDFNGTFDGKNYTISDLYIRTSANTGLGLFAQTTSTATISNVGLIDIDINTSSVDRVGALVGYNAGTITNSYSIGDVSSNGNGANGGFVGYNAGTITDSYSTVDVSGKFSAGGFVGTNEGIITNSYSTGDASTTSRNSPSGGFVVTNTGTITNSYSTGDVSGSADSLGASGGFVGENGGTITNAYSTGDVSGYESGYVGGFVGVNNKGTITNAYSTGDVSGNDFEYEGGFVGENGGTITNSFWNTETSSQSTSDGGTEKTTAELNDINTYLDAGWDIAYLSEEASNEYDYASLTMGGSSVWKFFLLKEVIIPEVIIPEVIIPEVIIPEVIVPEVIVPEVTIPEVTIPEVIVPKVTIPEVIVPEVTIPEVITISNSLNKYLHQIYIYHEQSNYTKTKDNEIQYDYNDSLKNGSNVKLDISVLDKVDFSNFNEELIFNQLSKLDFIENKKSRIEEGK